MVNQPMRDPMRQPMRDPLREVSLRLPDWTHKIDMSGTIYSTQSAKMSFVLDLLELHIEQGTGYPFAAAVFDGEHRLISIGVNYSSALFNSTAHAELLALQFAQAAIKRPYLPKKGEYSLVTSAQPCVMCSGAIFLSGVREVVTAALESDIQEIMGFGLGPLSSLWREDFVGKTISVREGVDRERARQLMRSYRSKFDTRRT